MLIHDDVCIIKIKTSTNNQYIQVGRTTAYMEDYMVGRVVQFSPVRVDSSNKYMYIYGVSCVAEPGNLLLLGTECTE